MPKHKSPGQKRKGIVRLVAFTVFAFATYGASSVLGSLTSGSLEWVQASHQVLATVSEMNYEQEEYRNLRGRKRYRDIYSVTYSYVVDGNEYSNTVEVSEALYSGYENGSQVAVLYAADDPYTSDIESNIELELSANNTVENMLNVVPYTGPAGLVLYWILSIVFVRESKKSLPEGFYTETSWLDVDDNYVVMLDGDDLVYFNIDAKQSGTVQEAYQNDATLEELVAISKSSKFSRIPLAETGKLTSHHNSDTISVEYGDDIHSLEFLNQTVKAHALERIKPRIPASLEYRKTERSRLQAAVPAMAVLTIIVGAMLASGIFILNLLLGVIAVIWVIPKVVSRLIDPTVTEEWLKPEPGLVPAAE